MMSAITDGLRLGCAVTALWWLGAAVRRAALPSAGALRSTVVSDAVLGATGVALLGTLQLLLGVAVRPTPMYLAAAIASGVAWRRRALSGHSPRPRPDAIVIALLVTAGMGVSLALLAARRDLLWWDGWAFWAFKARVLFLEGTLPPEVLASPGPYAHTHPRYPVGVPLVTWWFHRHLGSVAPPTASFVGALWFAALVGLTWETVRGMTDRRLAALATAAVAWIDPVVSHAVGGTADVTMGIALLGVVGALREPASDRASAWSCGRALLLGVLAKQEGFALTVVTALALGCSASRRRRPMWWLAVGLPVALWVGWQWHVAPFAATEPLVAEGLTPALVLDRALAVLATGRTVLLDGRWWPVAAMALLALLSARGRPTIGWLVALGYVATILGVYLVTPHDLSWLLRTSFVRVLSPVLPTLLVLSVRAIDDARARVT